MSPFDPPEIEDLIPHRDKMKLLDKVIAVSGDGLSLTSLAVVRPDWPLAGEKSISTVLGIELMAQTVGCLRGYDQSGRKDQPLRPDFWWGLKPLNSWPPPFLWEAGWRSPSAGFTDPGIMVGIKAWCF